MSQFVFRKELKGVDAYTRHKKLIRNYSRFYGQKSTTKESHNPEYDILKKHHKFIQPAVEEEENLTWEQRLAKRYYDQLFKEYAICDLGYYKQGRIALRWRTENEVIMGKGQFICASTRCEHISDLTSWEVNFGYMEDDVKKNELVKVRLCSECSFKLNYKTQKRMIRRDKKKRKRHHISEDDYEYEDEEGSGEKERKSKYQRRKQNDDNNGDGDRSEDSGDGQRISELWSKAPETKEEKTTEEEMADYFADLLQ